MYNNENKELNKLININEDAVKFYHSAREKTERPAFENTFAQLESLHKSVIMNLQTQMHANGSEPEVDETFIGQAQQFWGELMANVSNDVDETLVKHLEEAEDRCLHSIEDVMNSDEVSPTTKVSLESQLQTLQQSHDYMKALKDTLKAA